MQQGPARHCHLLGWWANAGAFGEHIGHGATGAPVDVIVALQVDKGTFQSLFGPTEEYVIRPGRGVVLDKTEAPRPTVFVPFNPPSALDMSALRRTDWSVA
jgi:hypothetical protein